MPGGGGAAKNASGNGSTSTGIHLQHKNVRKQDGTWGFANWRDMGEEVRKKIIAWDVAPEKEYFDQLFRVSRYQIIWGGELLRPSAITEFHYLAEADDFRDLFNGNG